MDISETIPNSYVGPFFLVLFDHDYNL